MDESQGGLTTDVVICGIEDTCCDGGLVTLADEARHIGLYHHILLGYRLAFQQSVIHILRMGKTHEAPGGETLRQCEFQSYPTFCIRRQLRIEESGFIEVLSNLHLWLRLVNRYRCTHDIHSSNAPLQSLFVTRVDTRGSTLH